MTSGCVRVIEKMKKDFKKLENCEDDTPEEILPLVMSHLTPALIEEARKKLNETEEVKPKALVELREMIEEEKNLVCPTHDLFLLAFLRSRKYNVKKAFKLLQNYWKFRKEYNKIYSVVDVENIISLFLRNFIGFMEYRDRGGCPVFVAKLGLWDTDIDSYESVFRAISAALVFSQEQEATQIAGFRIIMDFRGVTWAQLRYLTPANFILLIRSTQFCYPARYKGIHVLCENKALNVIWSMLYPFLTPKLKKRILFHGEDLQPLREYIHPSVLPEEFGGEAPPFDNTSRIDLIYSRVNSVVSQLNYGYKD